MLRAVGGIGNAVAQVLAKTGLPFIIAPTGTMANNGAITLGTALPTTYAACYLFLPANSINGANAAGWYYTVMSSTTVGQVFQQTYVSGQPTIPSAPTAWVSVGPGAYTGVTTAVQGPTFTIPANTLGPNGVLRCLSLFSYPTNADAKTLQVSVGGVLILNAAPTASLSLQALSLLYNRGVQNSNINFPAVNTTGLGTATNAATYSAINFANAQTVFQGGQLAVATDFVVMEAFAIEAMP